MEDNGFNQINNEKNVELQNMIDKNNLIINELYYSLNMDLMNETIKMLNVQEQTIALFGAVSSLFSGPKKHWIEIREFYKNTKLFDKLLQYENVQFTSFNRILDEYNKVKHLNFKQTSIDYHNFQQLYLLMIDNLDLMIKLTSIDKGW